METWVIAHGNLKTDTRASGYENVMDGQNSSKALPNMYKLVKKRCRTCTLKNDTRASRYENTGDGPKW